MLEHHSSHLGGVDLSILERLFKGDKARMAEWVRVYLEEAPAQFERLKHGLDRNDMAMLMAAAHDLRPQTHYLGATEMLESLVAIGRHAKEHGAEACNALVHTVFDLELRVEEDLRSWLGRAE